MDSERVLSPLVSRHSMAGGGVETEALGGVGRSRRVRPNGPWSHWAFRPLAYRDRTSDGDATTHFLVPLGIEKERPNEYLWQVLPVARWERHSTDSGREVKTFFALPGVYWSQREDGRIVRAWFPFTGVMENFLSYDRIEFTLFPLWLRTRRGNDVGKHVLFPLFGWTGPRDPELPSATGSHILPLYSHAAREGSYDRWTFLWPILHVQENDLRLSSDLQEQRWMVFPLVGRSARGARTDWIALWPFFGFGSDPRTGYSAFDAPWPFVRWLDAPTEGITRRRFWPFWSYYKDPTLESRWVLFPLVNWRSEIYPDSTVEGVDVLPFWQQTTRTDGQGGQRTWRKFWPFFESDQREPWEHEWAFPALNPLWQTPEIDEMYAWMWELWHERVDHDVVQQRSWLGLWRREQDEVEDRRNFSALWARRTWSDDTGVHHETSLLFGLLRWRTEGDSQAGEAQKVEWLPPAMPGPGWPLQRGERSASF
jgi:hypothetical protein